MSVKILDADAAQLHNNMKTGMYDSDFNESSEIVSVVDEHPRLHIRCVT